MKKLNTGFCWFCREWCEFATAENVYCKPCHKKMNSHYSKDESNLTDVTSSWYLERQKNILAHIKRVEREE